jgi:peptidoglycan DL-endopeptidase CwlO
VRLGVRWPGRTLGEPAQGTRSAGGRPSRTWLPVLGAAATLLAMAAGWPAGARAASVPASGAGVAEPARTLAGSALVMVPGGAGAEPVAPLRHRLPADLLVVSPGPLPRGAATAVRRLRGVRAAETVEAARVRVNGKFAAVLGVDPSGFRRFAAKPTASHSALWRSVAAGDIAVSFTMGRQAKLPAGSMVKVEGRQLEMLRVGGLGTVGIAGIDAVVSHAVARSLGFPVNNAIVISAPHAKLSALKKRVKAAMPAVAVVEQLVVPASPATSGSAGSGGTAAGSGSTGALLTPVQVTAFLKAAVSRVGMPYVWGAAGPTSFDCSGLVQWSLAQAGVVMPRVAADQARTGPAVPVSRLEPGDLLFYHTDPTAPGYISHVAIYLGKGLMIQAPQPGMNVEVVPVALGSDFAGAVDVSPAVAAAVAASPVG